MLGLLRELWGARATATVPVPEHLVNQLIAERLPPGGAIAELRLHPREGNAFDVRFRLAKPAFLPPFSVGLRVERQPRFPHDRRLLLRIEPSPLAMLAGPALRFVALPPGVSVDGTQVTIDVGRALEQQGLGELADYLVDLEIETMPGAFVVNARGEVPIPSERSRPEDPSAPGSP